MTTVFNILNKVGRRLPGAWYVGTVDSAADTSTIVDAHIGGARDAYNNGTVLMIRDAGGTSSAPQGESRVISDYSPNGTLSLETALSIVAAAGDTFGLIKPRYPRAMIVEGINAALEEIKLEEIDDSTTDTAATTKKYTLPTGVTKDNLLQVWVATNSAAPWNWSPVYNFFIDHDGGVSSIRFSAQQVYPRDVRYVFSDTNGYVDADTDTIDPRIHPDLVTAISLVEVLRLRYGKFTNAPSRETNALNEALRWEDKMRIRHMPTLPQAFPRISDTVMYSPGLRVPIPPTG